MKYVTIVRHGKAAAPESYDNDFDRPLMPRGETDVSLIGRILAGLPMPPDAIVTSPAVRALQTAALLAKSLGAQDLLNQEACIYEASAGVLMEVLRRMPDTVVHAVLVGHNPGMEELVAGLCSRDGRSNLRMGTAGLAYLQVETHRWAELQWGDSQLRLLIGPKILRDF
jgi:phosphohistidine phosphatase